MLCCCAPRGGHGRYMFVKRAFLVRTFKNLTKSFTSDKTIAISAKSLTKSYIFWFAQAKRDLSVTNVSFVFSWNLCNFPMLGDGHLSLNSFIFKFVHFKLFNVILWKYRFLGEIICMGLNRNIPDLELLVLILCRF